MLSFESANDPIATLYEPGEFVPSACDPIAILEDAVVFCISAEVPMAILSLPEVLF